MKDQRILPVAKYICELFDDDFREMRSEYIQCAEKLLKISDKASHVENKKVCTQDIKEKKQNLDDAILNVSVEIYEVVNRGVGSVGCNLAHLDNALRQFAKAIKDDLK